MADEIDLYDKKILFELDLDGRQSASKIAKKVRLPKETVNYRIKRLQQKGYLEKFYLSINASVIGYYYYRIYLQLHKATEKQEREVTDFLRNTPSCANLRMHEGSYDFSFIAMHQNPQSLKRFFDKLQERFGTVLREKNINLILSTHKLNQKFLYDGNTLHKTFYHAKIGNKTLDQTDIAILKMLANDSRTRLVDIANELGKDAQLINYRLKKMEKAEIIVDYSITTNTRLLDKEGVDLRISLANPQAVASIIEYFDSTKSCLFVYELLGDYDLSIELYVDDDEHLRKVLNGFREKFVDEYNDYDVSHIYKEYPITWVPFVSTPRKEQENGKEEGSQKK